MIVTSDLSGNGKGVAFVKQVNVTDLITGVGVGNIARVRGTFNYSLSGTFVATLRLERSLNNGLTWNPVTAFGEQYNFTVPCQESHAEPEDGALYRWNCTAYTSGTVIARISQ
jgi:hypothetical protein